MILFRSNVVGGVFVYCLVLMGALVGANTGYEAQTVNDTNITYTGEVLIVGDETTELNTSINTTSTQPKNGLTEHVPTAGTDSDLDGKIRSGVLSFTETALHAGLTAGFAIADKVATASFHLSPWVPQSIVSGLLNIAAILPVGLFGYRGYTQLSKVVR